MEDAYRKQCRFALLSFLVVLFLTHLAPVFYFIPQLTAFYILGFPAHYFITLVVGWIGTMVFYWFYIKLMPFFDSMHHKSPQQFNPPIVIVSQRP